MTNRERGSSLIETMLLGLLLLIPLVWVLGVLADLQRGALASTAAAREAGSDAARSHDASSADRAVLGAVRQAFVDHGLAPSEAKVRWSSDPGLPRGGRVEVRVSYEVTVLQMPFLGRVAGPSIEVDASHVARIDPYRSRDE